MTVADVKAALGTEVPDDLLQKPRMVARHSSFDRLEVDGPGQILQDDGTSATAIACRAIVSVPVGFEDAGPMEKIMNQTINDDEGTTKLQPIGFGPASRDEEARQSHRRKLRSNRID